MRILLTLSLCLTMGSAQAETATVAVATNFLTVAETLGAAYGTQSGNEIVIVSGATGKLAAQISNGAPFDAFLSADTAAPARLVETGKAVPDSVFTYATGHLVLWSTGAALGPDPAAILTAARHVAVANPELAPYGKAAMQAIESLGLSSLVADKLVQGENIGQTYALVHSGAADAGFVAASATRTNTQEGVLWPVPETAHEPIRQDAVLLLHGQDNAAAKEFLTFLRSDAARPVIADAGYGTAP